MAGGALAVTTLLVPLWRPDARGEDQQHSALIRRCFRMEPLSVLEWVLLLSVGASGVCMLALVAVLAVDRYRIHRKGKQSL